MIYEPTIDLLVVGELNPDIIISGAPATPPFGQVETIVDSIEMVVGSSSAIAACGAIRLGWRVAFVGVVGDDSFGRFMLDTLAAVGIDVSGCRVMSDAATAATVVINRKEDRAILTARGGMDRLRASHVAPEMLASARHLHVGSTYLQPALAADLPLLFAEAHHLGLTTSFDCNWDPTDLWGAEIDQLLQATDVFMPNLEEVRRITGRRNVHAATEELVRRATVPGQQHRTFTVAIKNGVNGAVAARTVAGATVKEVATAPALPITVVDTTGAGDSFDVGFLYGVVAGWSLQRALDLGTACGSLACRSVGGTAAQATLHEAFAALAAAGR